MTADIPVRDPERYLRTFWPSVRIVVETLPELMTSTTTWRRGAVTIVSIVPSLSPAERRAALAVEMQRLERGSVDEWQQATENAELERLAARWLLPDIEAVYRAVIVHGLSAASEKVALPHRVLVSRLRHLSRYEAYLIFDA